jgi:diguanylate cyclase (GGDEF)-like protein
VVRTSAESYSYNRTWLIALRAAAWSNSVVNYLGSILMAADASTIVPRSTSKDFRSTYAAPGASDTPNVLAPNVLETRREVAALRLINAHLVREIECLKQREAQVRRLADRDALTGLYNRRRMQEQLETAIAEAANLRQRVGLLFIDLDGFKAINDEYGHAVGDKILVAAAARIAARVRAGDLVCRYGGDEFVVLLPRLSDVQDATKVSEMIRGRLAGKYFIDDRSLHMTAAIGVALSPGDGRTAEQLLQRADESMYREKCRGRGSHVRHSAPCAADGAPAAVALSCA